MLLDVHEKISLSIELDGRFHDVKDTLLREFERAYLEHCLREASMNVSRASRVAGISRKHLRTLMSKHGITLRRNLDTAGAADAA